MVSVLVSGRDLKFHLKMAAQAADLRKTAMKSANYGMLVVNNLDGLRKNDELCDFTVSAEGKSIRVHKVLLAAMSDYFRAMLQGPMRESQEARVDLKGFTAESLEAIIDFIYSGTIIFDYLSLSEILNAASHLQIKAALDLCSDYMISLLSFNNADDLLSIADTYSLDKVLDHYSKKVLSNFEEFSMTDQFLRLTPNQLCRYLADDSLQVKSEHLLYDIVGKWYSHDQSRQESLDNIFKNIRFCLMSPAQLNQLGQHWLTLQFRSSITSISEGLKYHSDCSVGHPWMIPATRLRSKHRSLALIRPFEITAYNIAEGRFYQLVSDISGSRDCRVVEMDNFVYMCRVVDCGGGTLMNSLLRFDPRHMTLQELTPCRRLRIDPALAAVDGALYLLGGTNEHLTILDSVEYYDVKQNVWVDLMPLPMPTHAHSAIVAKGMIYVTGGVSGPEQLPTASVYAYNPSTRVWQCKSSMHCARRLHEMTSVQDRLYVLGGIGTHSYHQQTQIPIESYDPATDQWTLLSATLAGRSVGHFLAYETGILSIGREHYDATEDDLWLYNVEEDQWKPFVKVPRRSLASTMGTLLHLNFFDEKTAKRVISDKR